MFLVAKKDCCFTHYNKMDLYYNVYTWQLKFQTKNLEIKTMFFRLSIWDDEVMHDR